MLNKRDLSGTFLVRCNHHLLHGVCGVYSFVHRITGRRYIGSSIDIGGRITGHIGDASRGVETKFHASIRRHGLDEFDLELIYIGPRSYILGVEGLLIQHYDSVENGLNMSIIPTAPFLGRKHSEKSKIKMREAKINLSPEERKRISMALSERVRKPHSEATKIKIGNAHRGKKLSPETIEKLRKFYREKKAAQSSLTSMMTVLDRRVTV